MYVPAKENVQSDFGQLPRSSGNSLFASSEPMNKTFATKCKTAPNITINLRGTFIIAQQETSAQVKINLRAGSQKGATLPINANALRCDEFTNVMQTTGRENL
ncbi:hypothetical protein Zmor_004606 [Zophobas morio]|uniref:Uncharacterized protein n=1 Tax=Zophobas morio TaxID=2755281 RepID=A0AA38IRQ4_9CUCU|nr:hypothetical protein Zmor_004606 [Zophobas morio]